jgi:3-(3-hydroxy-phenyl)propionate hydroxylase
LRGQADASVLDSYDIERRPHVRSMIDLARFMGKLVMPSNGLTAWWTHGLMALAARVPRLRRLFENLEIKPPHRFKRGCFVPRGRVPTLARGGTFPQAWLRTSENTMRLSDHLLGSGFAILGFGVNPCAGLPAALIRAWRSRGSRFVHIHPCGKTAPASSEDAVCEDITGAFMPFVVPLGWIAVVRPDRIVLHDGPADHRESVLREALRLLSSKAGTDPIANAASASPVVE